MFVLLKTKLSGKNKKAPERETACRYKRSLPQVQSIQYNVFFGKIKKKVRLTWFFCRSSPRLRGVNSSGSPAVFTILDPRLRGDDREKMRMTGEGGGGNDGREAMSGVIGLPENWVWSAMRSNAIANEQNTGFPPARE